MKPAVWFGADVLLHRPEGAAFRERLRGRRVALLAHPASVDARVQPVWELIGALPDVRLTALLSPQHGFAGEKQDDMVESADAYHPRSGYRFSASTAIRGACVRSGSTGSTCCCSIFRMSAFASTPF